MPDYQVGDEVRVFDVNDRGRHPGGRVGKVVKTGRTLVTVTSPGCNPAEGEKFSMSDGRKPDAYRHRYIRTLDEVAADRRREAALSVLSDRRIDIHRASLTTEQIEALAEVVKT